MEEDSESETEFVPSEGDLARKRALKVNLAEHFSNEETLFGSFYGRKV